MRAPTRVDRFTWERAIRTADLRSPVKCTAYALGSYASKAGGQVHPGLDQLQQATGLCRRSLVTTLAALRDEGWLHRTRKGSSLGRRALADDYVLTLPPGMPVPSTARSGAPNAPDDAEQVHQMHEQVHVVHRTGAPDAPHQIRDQIKEGEGGTRTANPRQCERHAFTDTPPPCIPCKKAREAHDVEQTDAHRPPPWPRWCGDCREDTRQIEVADDAVARCPTCHPQTRRARG